MYVNQTNCIIKLLLLLLLTLIKKAGLGSKQQDMLLSSFIKRVYAEIENNQKNKPIPAIPLQQPTPESTMELGCNRPTKRAMSTPEAIAELNKLCKQEDPCTVYTDMVKIGEGYVDFKLNLNSLSSP